MLRGPWALLRWPLGWAQAYVGNPSNWRVVKADIQVGSTGEQAVAEQEAGIKLPCV